LRPGLLLELFVRFLKIGLVGFGGGWAILPIIQREIVEDAGWITPEEYSNLVAIAGSTPGPVAVNAATYVGFKLAGPLGAAVATLGVILPPFTIISLVAYGIATFAGNRYVQALINGLKGAVLGLMILALYSMAVGIREALPKPMQLLAVALIALYMIVSILVFKFHPIVSLLVAAAIGIVLGVLGLW